MNDNLRNILLEIEAAINDIGEIIERGPIYSSTEGRNNYGREAIYRRELANGITLRLVNDGSYSIGGNSTVEGKREFIGALEEILRSSSNEVSQELRDAIYPIIDAVERSIDEPTRDSEIVDRNGGEPPRRDEEPPRGDEEPPRGDEEPPRGDEEPTRRDEEPPRRDEEPPRRDEESPRGDEEPPRRDEESPRGDEEPPRRDEEPPRGDEGPQDNRTPEEKRLDEEMKLLEEINSNFLSIRSIYDNELDKLKGTGLEKKSEKDDYTVIIIATNMLLKELADVATKILEASNKNGKDAPADYRHDLLQVLIGCRKDYELILRGILKLDKTNPKLKKSLDELIKKVDKKIAALEKELNIKPPEKETEGDPFSNDGGEDDKKVSIVFDAKKGTYTLYEGANILYEINPDTIMGTRKEILILDSIKRKNPELDTRDVERYIDPNVYDLLRLYDEKHGTNYADDFVKNVFDPEKSKMPIELRYLLSGKNPLDKNTYRDIKFFAKTYEKDEKAIVERLKTDPDERSLLENLKEFGLNFITAIANLGHNIKDVITGEKKVKELFSLDAFKRLPETTQKEDDERMEDEESLEEQDNIGKPEINPRANVRVDFTEQGMYELSTGEDIQEDIRFGDIALENIGQKFDDIEYIESIQEKYDISDSEMDAIDPTVCFALEKLESISKEYQGIAREYIEAMKKGEKLSGIFLGYDLVSLNAINSKNMSNQAKKQIQILAKAAKKRKDGVMSSPDKRISRERARRINEEIEEITAGEEYNKYGYIMKPFKELYTETDLEMSGRVKKILDDQTNLPELSEEERTQKRIEIVKKMAKKRDIPLKEEDGREISAQRIFYMIINYEADRLRTTPGYLMPEEKSKMNLGRPEKGKSSEKPKRRKQEEAVK